MLSAVMTSLVMLNVVMLSIAVLSVVMSLIMSYYAECNNAGCHYSELCGDIFI